MIHYADPVDGYYYLIAVDAIRSGRKSLESAYSVRNMRKVCKSAYSVVSTQFVSNRKKTVSSI